MSGVQLSEVPFKNKSLYRPRIAARKCHTCRHPDREAIDYALSMNKRTLGDIGEQYGLSIAQLCTHRKKHLSAAIVEASTEYGIVNAKDILERVKTRSTIAHGRFVEDNDKLGHGKLATETDALLLKATGNWKESHDIDLHGSIQLSAADKADADYLAFMQERHPEMVAEYAAWAEGRLLTEIKPALTDDIVDTSARDADT